MKAKDIEGKHIRFNKLASLEYEWDFDEGMIAKVVSVVWDGDQTRDGGRKEKLFVVCVDFKPWEEYNKKFGRANYYDEHCRKIVYLSELDGELETDGRKLPFEIISDDEANKVADKPPYELVSKAFLASYSLLFGATNPGMSAEELHEVARKCFALTE